MSKTAGIAALIAACEIAAVLVAGFTVHALVLGLIVALALIALGAFSRWAFLPAHHLPRNRVRDMRARLHLRLHPGRGHATILELHLKWGRLSAFRQSKLTRPDLPWLYRLTHPQAHSVYLGRAQLGHGVRAGLNASGAVIGPPQSGKTRVLSRIGAAAGDGALILSSSKPDIYKLTSGIRAQSGPVYVFNPMCIGGIPSNVRWNPLEHCADPAVAIRVADSFAYASSTSGAEDAQFWQGKASDGLRGFFSAAALRNSDMRRVAAWVGGQQITDAIDTLRANGYDDWASVLANDLIGEAAKTSSTIKMVMGRAMSWLLNPELAAAVLPGPGQQFDVDRFILDGGTLYLLARTDTDDNVLAPLFAALVSEIHERALQLASRMPGGKLQPNMTMVLDEVCRIAPVPLDSWLADSASQNVVIWSGFQSISQLRARWGADGAQKVLDCSTVKVITPGVTDPEMLQHLSRLCGKVSYRQHKADESWQFSEVMDESMIRQLPDKHALIVRSNRSVLIARLAAGWDYRPYKRLRRRGEHIAPVAAPAVLAAQPVAEPLSAAAPGTLVLTPAPEPVQAGSSNGHPWSNR